jgi:pyruvate,water dikinase
MTRMGLPVPEGIVITTGASAEETAEALASLSDKYTYAVRSSALNEDGTDNSFAGQYETVTDVKKADLGEAVKTVISSAGNARVKEYLNNANEEACGIAVVVQRFVRPQYAGVLFTADAVTGSSRYMIGNFVEGEGEALVSGQKNAREFRIDAIKYSYSGDDVMRKHAKKLFKYAAKIKDEYKCEVDIEWAVSDGRLYILQARPITTLKRFDPATFRINGSKAGEYMLTKTNVGEIFMKPLTPATYSMLEIINNVLYLPQWLDSIEGQAYMNVSVLCSMLMAMGMKEEKAFEAVRDLVGNLPEGQTVPVFPFSGKKFRKNLWEILTGKKAKGHKCRLSKAQKKEMVDNFPDVCRALINEIRTLNTNEELYRYGCDVLAQKLSDGLAAFMSQSGSNIMDLFSMRKKIVKLTGEETANRLLGGCLGVIESMKPLLMLEDVISGKVTEEEFMRTCGQRAVNEMEFSEKHPYEIKDYVQQAIEDYRTQGVSAHELKAKSETEFAKALDEYEKANPSKSKKVRKLINKFAKSNAFREDFRAKGVWSLCVMREWLLGVSRANGLGDDVFMLYIKEAIELTKGNTSVLANIQARKANYEKYLSNPPFPNVIIGRFEPSEWLSDPNRRNDFYRSGSDVTVSSDIKGFPGAAGKITARVRVIPDVSRIDEIEPGEILVTGATNIGWTRIFPKVSAIVTDIGAPLSHAAIVAREFGIPAVVGCGNATTVLKTGDLVEVDGTAGTVTIKNG